MSRIFQLGSKVTKEQIVTLQLMAEGYTTPEIAKKLEVHIKTIEARRSRIFVNLGARNGLEAIYIACKLDLI